MLNIEHPTSNIQHPTSNIERPMFGFGPLSQGSAALVI
jgi:hypothetical protein